MRKTASITTCSAAIEAFHFLGGEKRKATAKALLEKAIIGLEKELSELETRKKALINRKQCITTSYYEALKQQKTRKK